MNLVSEWHDAVLGDLVDITRGRSYRSAQLQDNEDVALVTLKSFDRGGGYRHDGLKPYVGPYKPEQVLTPGEMVVAQTDITQNADVIGRPAIVPDGTPYDTLVASLDAAIVRNVAPSKLDLSYLYYRMFARDYVEHVKNRSTGTTVLHLARDAVPEFELTLPPLPEQRRIAHILGTLDDKIELNRRMNETLGEMARAIFKDWFVDFGPVRAKMEGRDAYLPDHIWSLFPDNLADSELGEIPEGWEVKALDEIANFRNGLALQKFRPKQNEDRLPVVKIAQLRSGYTKDGPWASANITPECIIDDGDVVFAWSGSLMVKVWCGGQGALNQHLFKVTSAEYPKWLYFHYTNHHLPEFQRIAADKTTTMGHIKRHHLSDAKCVIPNQDLLSAMDGILDGLLVRSIAATVESRTLAAMRDTLLPKLVSGEVRIKT